MSKQYEGSCQCGENKYRLLSHPVVLYICHCRDCQKQSSSAFGMSLRMYRKDVQFMSGQPGFYSSTAESGGAKLAAFCQSCGSRLYHATDHHSDTINIKAGTLNDTSWLQPVGQLWTKSAQKWLKIHQDSTLCYDAQPESDVDLYNLWNAQIQDKSV